MKRLLLPLVVLAISCSATPPPMTFTQEIIESKFNQVAIEITYPKVVSSDAKVADSINKVILANCFSQSDTIQEASPYEALIEWAKLCDADSMPFTYTVDWSGFENTKFVSISLDCYYFAGGAHGSTQTRSLTFDKATGAQIKILEHVTDTLALRRIIIDEYIEQNGLDATKSAAELGYFVTSFADLTMPSVILLTDKGLLIQYQQYEVAAYVIGITEATIPYEKLKGILKLDTTDLRTIEIIH